MHNLFGKVLSFCLAISLSVCCVSPAAFSAPDDAAALTGVYFSLRGLNADDGSEELWIDGKNMENVRAGATAASVILDALEAEGYEQTGAEDGYIKSVKTPDGFTLSEMYGDMPYSGWLFKVNSLMPEVGMDAQVVEDGDHILLYFTKDFMADFAMPQEGAGSAGTEDSAAVNPFSDVGPEDWYCGYVETVYKEGLMLGTDEGIFSPGETLTRAMFAVILYRIEGAPEYESDYAEPDIDYGFWYSDAAIWLVGYDKLDFGPEFDPDGEITCGQLILFLNDYLERGGQYAGLTVDILADPEGTSPDPGDAATRALAAAAFAHLYKAL